MSSVYSGPPDPAQPPETTPPPPPPPPGAGARPARQLSRVMLAAGIAVVAGTGSFLGVQAMTASARVEPALTTAQIAGQTDPGLVDIDVTLGYQQAQAAGTGMVLTPSGEVATNNHVIQGATAITVTDIGNGHSYRATVTGYDQARDIAVLQLQGASGLHTVSLASSGAAVGQRVVGIGNAGGAGGTPSAAAGTITGLDEAVTAADSGSGTSEQLSGLIEDDAPIQPGDSGGPLADASGQVIGIDTAASAAPGSQGAGPPQAAEAFAIPVSQALPVIRQIEAGSASASVHTGSTGFLGVEIAPASAAAQYGVPSGSGALVTGVTADSAAGSAGITAGDVITSAGGKAVSSPSALQSAMQARHGGDTVRLGWTDQAGQAHSATVALAAGPPQ